MNMQHPSRMLAQDSERPFLIALRERVRTPQSGDTAMSMHALVLDTEEAKLAAAVERANAWVDTARPVIKAYLALDMIHGDLRAAEFSRRGNRRFGTAATYPELVCRDAGSDVGKAVELLAKSIDDIRSDTLNDEKLNASKSADEAEWDHVEAFNDELDRQCVTVDAAVKAEDA